MIGTRNFTLWWTTSLAGEDDRHPRACCSGGGDQLPGLLLWGSAPALAQEASADRPTPSSVDEIMNPRMAYEKAPQEKNRRSRPIHSSRTKSWISTCAPIICTRTSTTTA